MVFVSHGSSGASLHLSPLYRLMKAVSRSKHVHRVGKGGGCGSVYIYIYIYIYGDKIDNTRQTKMSFINYLPYSTQTIWHRRHALGVMSEK